MKRKIMLSTLAIATAATAVGGGTFASFHDNESTAANPASVTAGTMDLVVGGSAVAADLSVDNVAPGDTSGLTGYTLQNTGTIDGTLRVFLVLDHDDENGVGEPETEDGDTLVNGHNEGELDDNLYVTVDGQSFGPGGTVAAGLNTINEGQRLEITNLIWGGDTPPIELAAGGEYPGAPYVLNFGWNVNGSANDTIQSDSLVYHLEFELDQA